MELNEAGGSPARGREFAARRLAALFFAGQERASAKRGAGFCQGLPSAHAGMRFAALPGGALRRPNPRFIADLEGSTMRNGNTMSTVIAAAVAGSMVIGGAVVAQSSGGASSPAVNDRTSSGWVGGPASSPGRAGPDAPAPVSPPRAEPGPSAPASTPASDRSRSGVVTPAGSHDGDEADSRHAGHSGARHARRAARSDRN